MALLTRRQLACAATAAALLTICILLLFLRINIDSGSAQPLDDSVALIHQRSTTVGAFSAFPTSHTLIDSEYRNSPTAESGADINFRCLSSFDGSPIPELLVVATRSEAPRVLMDADLHDVGYSQHGLTDGSGTVYLGSIRHEQTMLSCYDKIPSGWMKLTSAEPTEGTHVNGRSAMRELSVDVGATYYLDIVLPDGYIDSDFSVRVSGYERFSPCIGALRMGTRAWTRLINSQHRTQGQKDLVVTVESTDELWVGRSDIPSNYCLDDPPIVIRLSGLGRVSGVVRDQDQRPIQNAMIWLSRVDAVTDTHVGISDIEGRFSIATLPGRYVARVQAESMLPVEQIVESLPMNDIEYVFELDGNAPQITVYGSVVSNSGTFSKDIRARVEPGGCGDSVVWSSVDGQVRGSFAISCPVAERYEVFLEGDTGQRVSWKPAVALVKSGEIAEFTILDDDSRTAVCIEVVCEYGNDDVGSVNNIVFAVSDEYRTVSRFDMTSSLSHIVLSSDHYDGDDLDVVVSRNGYRPVVLAGEQFHSGACSVGCASISCRVVLERGYGRVIRVVDTHGHPVSGIQVCVDGMRCGITNRSGFIVINIPDTASCVDVVSSDYDMVESDDFSESGALRLLGSDLSVATLVVRSID